MPRRANASIFSYHVCTVIVWTWTTATTTMTSSTAPLSRPQTTPTTLPPMGFRPTTLPPASMGASEEPMWVRRFSKRRSTPLCMCVCVFSSHLFWTSSSLDVPAGVTQEEGHTGFLIHLPSAVHAFIFLARGIQPFLSLVDREVEFCVLTIKSFSTCWAFLFLFLFFSEEKSQLARFKVNVPTYQKATRLPTELPGRPAASKNPQR